MLNLEENTEIYITKQMIIKTILHLLTLIEYPPTSEDGVAIVYHIEGWQDVNSAFAEVSIKSYNKISFKIIININLFFLRFNIL